LLTNNITFINIYKLYLKHFSVWYTN
jgi:hypothetical protein